MGDVPLKGLVVIFDRRGSEDNGLLSIAGAVTRDVAHRRGIPHGTALVAVTVAKQRKDGRLVPHVLLHRRPDEKRISPRKLDICGGHIEGSSSILESQEKWDSVQYIERLIADTALREVAEECRIEVRRVSRLFRFEKSNLRRFGALGAFDCGLDDADAKNREYATLYSAFVPRDVVTLGASEPAEAAFEVVETVMGSGGERQVSAQELELVPFAELVHRFVENPEDFADGISRVLSRAVREHDTTKALERFLEAGLTEAGWK